MTSQSEFLKTIRRHILPEQSLPALDGFGIVYDDRAEQFTKVLHGVGGQSLQVADVEEAHREICELPAYRSAKKICSLLPSVGVSNVDMSSIVDPHELEDVDLAIVRGEFGVAENGAIWIDTRSIKHRVIYFIAQHVVILFPASQLVDNMHRAYERLRFDEPGFGMFLSGPSKTADIEQSLVIGAHGPRSLTVVMVEKGLD
ncbi:MAG: lactate utilization protein C [Planctomycetaceae bacterium]